jgi:acetyl-CoA acetyltransferase
MRGLRGRTAIVGIGLAGCGEAPGFSELDLAAEASRRAVKDAGLSMKDIDGVVTASLETNMPVLSLAEYLGIRPSFSDGTGIGGSSFIAHLIPAAMALELGLCHAVLVAYGSTARTGRLRGAYAKARSVLNEAQYEAPYRLGTVSAYALAAARHMHLYGTTREQLAKVAVDARAWARLNPAAFSRDPLSIEDVLNARMVSDPLTVRDCCLVTDGAGAYVLVRSDRARDISKHPIAVLGVGAAHSHRNISSMPDITATSASQSGAAAFAMAGLRPSDVDVAQIYDAFTFNVLLFLEDLGFCRRGESGHFVMSGAIAPGGSLPVNTNGGGLSCVHPGMYGIFAMIEAIEQLRGAAGQRQVPGAQIALAHGNGGFLSSQATAILGDLDCLPS